MNQDSYTMVCRAGQTCIIHLYFSSGGKNSIRSIDRYALRGSTTGKELYDYIEKHCHMLARNFKLYLLTAGKLIDLSEMKDKTMSEIGVDFSYNGDSNEVKHALMVTDPADTTLQKQAGYDGTVFSPALVTPPHTSVWGEDSVNFKSFMKSETNYVGLVNQAMTCYLNSLLQALYMTPEFRNALYNWEYVDGSEKDEADSIPYQLQNLFLNLQTSTKSAVETTSLTKSFGWDSTEAWQQHDIQELCRVMFDALEQKFKNTEQADLINRLYEGKMIDYVKCLECGTEKSREDTFLDIPLPVRPFNSNVAYNSVEEAIRAFVQYETLEGNNQYHCEKCNKKCNAHKGLKFTKFPYLLTLHLKRFDFDFKTFHRIKLNDKVTFPDILNLNSFISSTTNQESPSGEEDIGLSVKCDDSLTTDSGRLDDDCPPCENNLSNSNHSTNHDQDDEGIDMSNGPSTSNCSTHNHENERNRENYLTKGPYQYELFSIMIHSGSASGGHYYVYIKDFRTQEWLCFNDQSVTQITHDDIQKTYGGGPTREYYSGAYSSSTNAYMLMYRQIDPARNALPMQAQDFPKHIQELLKKMKESEDNDRKNWETQTSMPKLKVYCHYPTLKNKIVIKMNLLPDVTWAEAEEMAYRKFDLNGVVHLNQCRLVSYEPNSDSIICSYEGREQDTVANILYNQNRFNLLLEIRSKDQKFETYLPGDIVTKVYVLDVVKEDIIDGPINVRGSLRQTVKEYKQMLGKIINMDPKQMRLILNKHSGDMVSVENDDKELQSEEFYNAAKVFVISMCDSENRPFHMIEAFEILDIFENVISLHVQLPDSSKEILEELNIPSLQDKYRENEKLVTNNQPELNSDESHCDVNGKCNEVSKSVKSNDTSTRNMSPQLGEGEEWNTPEQSNSEDSSLSDSDKTLVGDGPEDYDRHLPYLPSNTANTQTIDMLNQIGLENWDVDDNSEYYFKAILSTNSNQRSLKVLVDKRMRASTLRTYLEPYVGAPAEYFEIFRYSTDSGELECSCPRKQTISYDDGERLNIKLGRALRSGEIEVKLYQFFANCTEPYKFLCKWIISKDKTVGEVKKEILAEIKRKHNIDIPFERCRLREKFLRLASKVLLDDQNFEDLRFYSQFEMIIQELPDKDPVTNSNQIVLFVRRWLPERMQLGRFQEIVMDGKSIGEMRKKLSAISDIPEEHIDVARAKDYFPFDISVLLIQNDLDWKEHRVNALSLNIEDGSVFFYKDRRENLKHLTSEEVKEIATQEISRLIPSSTTSGYSARKERSLRIYLDAK